MPASTAPISPTVEDQVSSGTAISLSRVTKSFGDFSAVKDLDLDIRSGEFFSLLGPSGSGKTTVLRMVAGFEPVTSGHIYLHGSDVTGKAPFERNVNTVFQDYALFPHLTVAQNVGYGLKLRKTPRAERVRRVAEALEMVRLPQVADRLPSQLSGGQRQRIALARALILRPQVLLLDEPLGALDKQLREQMQIELKQIQREVGITFVFVTHDQEEALTLSDRVAVFNDGGIEQVGSPEDLYERPATRFVATFLGSTNLVEGTLAKRLTGSDALVSIRPERIHIAAPGSLAPDGFSTVSARIEEIVYTGPTTRYVATTETGDRLIVQEQNDSRATACGRGDAVELQWPSRFNFAVS
ncbi:ABC transporter ATP-binding protein [Arthrobacter sp. Helios]|uniref:ABC transporter ATP-binding protein n=1 Tax=Arthrobacter sp. Helios TaxID=2828862 RepID=UPI00206A9062|nr:ABC transporter ATP-binding protein [Arthrobacter sp. Helios]UPO76231.1 ABC transporter ATP-binding protein [Arthrobacter sp. Helios]